MSDFKAKMRQNRFPAASSVTSLFPAYIAQFFSGNSANSLREPHPLNRYKFLINDLAS